MAMTLKQMSQKEYGKNWRKKLGSRLVKLFDQIDSIPGNQKPADPKIYKKALSN